MRRLTAFLAVLMWSAPAWAQVQGGEGEQTEPRRYTVEIIIFRYAENVGAGGELFLPDEPVPDEDSIGFTDRVAPAEPEPAEKFLPRPDPEFVLLDEEDFQLAEAHGRLERLDAYQPLMHFGWTQLALPRDQTEAIPLYRFGRPPQDLDGTLMLYLSRYLHLVTDLQLRNTDGAAPRRATSGFNSNDTTTGEPGAPTFYRIQESRIMKHGELRYFDHPKFGVLARVSRIEEETPPEDGELLGYPLQ